MKLLSKKLTLILRQIYWIEHKNIKFLLHFGGTKRGVCQIQGWSEPKWQNLKSCLSLHKRQGKKPTPPDGWNLEKSNLLSFTLFFWERKKGTVYVRHHIPIHQSGYTFLPRNSGKPSPTLLPHMTNKDTRLLSC